MVLSLLAICMCSLQYITDCKCVKCNVKFQNFIPHIVDILFLFFSKYCVVMPCRMTVSFTM